MRFLIALVFLGHGFAHLVGFFVFWRLAEFEEMPYKTTLLAGRIDVGETGIRVVGILWLAAALAFFTCLTAVIPPFEWWLTATLWTTVFSLALCISGWPDSRFGVVANLLILAFLAIGGWLGWLPVAVR